ncbi:MAG: phosphate signaling complex protein PhoU [Chitinivibrionales bacterium]
MSIHLMNEINHLIRMLLELCTITEEALRKSIDSFNNLDVQNSEEIIQHDEIIDTKEVEVEEECLKLLALHQPVANDLRLIIAVLKINNDLERIADLAVNIAKRTKILSNLGRQYRKFDFSLMFNKSLYMLKQSIDALIESDKNAAYQISGMDDDLDRMNKEMIKDIIKEMKSHPEYTEELLQYFSISKAVERIGDHAVNICDDIIYITEGNIVRHSDNTE